MGHISLPTVPAPRIVLADIRGNLQVKGWDRPEVYVRTSSSETPTLEALDDAIQVKCQTDCTVRLPQEANVRLEIAHGNARFKLLENTLVVEQVKGNLALQNIGPASVKIVKGNLLAKQIQGDLSVEEVAGNAMVRDVLGNCVLAQVTGNLDLREMEGSVQALANGNLRLRLSLLLGESYTLEAKGNLSCKVPDDADLEVNLHSASRKIRFALPAGKQSIQAEEHRITLGDGSTPMQLTASGNLYFESQPVEWDQADEAQTEFEQAFADLSREFGEQIGAQINSQLESHLEMLEEQLQHLSTTLGQVGFSQAETNRILQRARLAGEKASTHTQEQMRRAQEKLERKLAAAQRKAELRARAAERRQKAQRRRAWSLGRDTPESGKPLKTQVSDEERLLILKMLEEKKITLQQAETLLAALEGNGN